MKRREATIAARKFCASFGLADVKVEIADRRGLKRRRSSTVGDGGAYSGCLTESGIPNHRDPSTVGDGAAYSSCLAKSGIPNH